jgi:hypothetical protein
MMAKLKSLDALPQEAQTFYAGYLALLARGKQSEPAAAEATIQTVYRSYYSRMGGTGIAPIIKTASRSRPMPDDNNNNVTPFRRIKPNTPPPPREKKKLPVALIFIGLILLAVAWRYLTKGSL